MNRPGNEVEMRHAENYVDAADLRTLKAKTFPIGTTFFPKVGATLLTNKRRIAAVEMLVDNNVMGAVATDVDPWFLYSPSAPSTWQTTFNRARCPRSISAPSVR
jgi:type I restriction enzyme S subunit